MSEDRKHESNHCLSCVTKSFHQHCMDERFGFGDFAVLCVAPVCVPGHAGTHEGSVTVTLQQEDPEPKAFVWFTSSPHIYVGSLQVSGDSV